MHNYAIKAVNLKKERHDNNSGISLEIEEGSFVHMLGKNGSGKSTLLHILSGYDKNFTGDLFLTSRELTWEKDARKLKRLVGFIPQEDYIYGNLTPLQLLKTYSNLFMHYNSVEKAKIINQTLDQLCLQSKADRKIRFLSVGDRKRVSIAIELLNPPEILMLDEPYAGLDPDNYKYLNNLLRNINQEQNITIIFSTHQIIDFKKNTDIIFLLNNTNFIARKFHKTNIDNILGEYGI